MYSVVASPGEVVPVRFGGFGEGWQDKKACRPATSSITLCASPAMSGDPGSADEGALEELEAAERRNRALLDAIPDNMFRIRRDGTYVDFHSNRPGSLTLAPDRIVGTNLADHMSLADAALRLEAIERVIESGQGESFELQVTTPAGEVVDHEVRMEKSGEDEVLAITRDITERKRTERALELQREELRRSRARILEAETAERRRLERNLHDGAQARLVAVSLSLRLVQSRLEVSPQAAAELLAGASSELAVALDELRDLARGLHPAILAVHGLGPALDALAERAPLLVEVSDRPDVRLPEPVEVAAFYVVAEALTNVAKYAKASHATMESGVIVGRRWSRSATTEWAVPIRPEEAACAGSRTGSRHSAANSRSRARPSPARASAPPSRWRRTPPSRAGGPGRENPARARAATASARLRGPGRAECPLAPRARAEGASRASGAGTSSSRRGGSSSRAAEPRGRWSRR